MQDLVGVFFWFSSSKWEEFCGVFRVGWTLLELFKRGYQPWMSKRESFLSQTSIIFYLLFPFRFAVWITMLGTKLCISRNKALLDCPPNILVMQALVPCCYCFLFKPLAWQLPDFGIDYQLELSRQQVQPVIGQGSASQHKFYHLHNLIHLVAWISHGTWL